MLYHCANEKKQTKRSAFLVCVFVAFFSRITKKSLDLQDYSMAGVKKEKE